MEIGEERARMFWLRIPGQRKKIEGLGLGSTRQYSRISLLENDSLTALRGISIQEGPWGEFKFDGTFGNTTTITITQKITVEVKFCDRWESFEFGILPSGFVLNHCNGCLSTDAAARLWPQSIPLARLTMNGSGPRKDEECPVCLEGADNADETAFHLECGNTYHKTCLSTWSAQLKAAEPKWFSTEGPTCPQCRGQVTDPISPYSEVSELHQQIQSYVESKPEWGPLVHIDPKEWWVVDEYSLLEDEEEYEVYDFRVIVGGGRNKKFFQLQVKRLSKKADYEKAKCDIEGRGMEVLERRQFHQYQLLIFCSRNEICGKALDNDGLDRLAIGA